MSDAPLSFPTRPSLEQLRKQAKERLASMPDARLADAQFTLARDYGFDSWPKLVRHVEAVQSPEIAQHDRMAYDMVAACHHDDEPAMRLMSSFTARCPLTRFSTSSGVVSVTGPVALQRC